MYLAVKTSGSEAKVILDGVFSHMDAKLFKRVMALAENESLETIQVDIQDLHYIDDAGVGLLMMLRLKARQNYKKLLLSEAQGEVRDMLEHSGLGALLAKEFA